MIRRLILAVTAVILLAGLVVGTLVWWMVSGDGVRRSLEQQASAWLGQPVAIEVAHARLFPRPALRLERVTVGSPVRLTLGAVDVSADLRSLLSRRIEEGELVLSDSRIQMPLPFTRAQAPPARKEAGAEPSSAGRDGTSGLRLVSIRSIVLRNVTLASRGREIHVEADSSLDGSTLRVPRFTATSGTTAIDAEGLVDLGPRVEARFRVKANHLDVDELLALADAFSPAQSSGTGAGSVPVRIAARVSSETATAGGVTVRQFATDAAVEGGAVSFSPLTFQLFGGRYQGSLEATLGAAMSVTLRSRILDVDVAQLAAFGGAEGAVSGRLTGAGTFSGQGADLSRVLTSARGSGTATVTNGTIRNLNLVRTVILFFGRPVPGAGVSSDRFERLDARVSLARQVVTADAISLHSPDADIVGNGTLNLVDKTLDGAFDLSLSESLSAQAGTDLARFTREGKRIVLPATLGGKLGAPRLTINAAAALQRGLKNEVQRRLKGLLDRVTGGDTTSPAR